MGFRSTQHNQSSEDVLSHIDSFLSANGWLTSKLRIHSFALKQDGKYFNGLTIVRPIEPDKISSNFLPHSLHYERVSAFIQDVTLDEFKEFVYGLDTTNYFSVANAEIQVSIQAHAASWEMTRVPGGSSYDNRACLLCNLKTYPNYGLPNEELLDYTYPYFASAGDLIADWTGLNLSVNSALWSSIVIIVPDARAHFSNIERTGRGLTVTLDGIAVKKGKLKLKGEASTQEGSIKIDADIINGQVEVSMTSTPSTIKLWVIGEDDFIYDEYIEPLWYDIRRVFNITTTTSASGWDKIIGDALNSGENETVEYKEHIEKDDSKIEELIHTILAFLNSRGGIVLIGVTDWIEVRGIEKEVLKHKKGKMLPDAAMEKYLADIKQAVNRAVPGKHNIKYDLVEFANRLLLVIQVAEGDNKPYSWQRNNEIYVRKGANNVRATREDLKNMFGPKSIFDQIRDRDEV